MDITSFLHMGGYGSFIWPSYAAMIAVFFFGLFLPLKRFRQIKAKLRSKN